ncbi:MAG: exo-alpha-sialidase [Christensenellales bacterium]
MEFIKLFDKESCGQGNYRIPAVVVTNNGVVVACADERYYGGGDNPNRIDKVVRRSLDGGKTWGDKIVAVREYGESKQGASAAIDPTLLYDGEKGRIYMLYDHTPAGVGILSCVSGVGEDEHGYRYIIGQGERFTARDGKLYSGDTATDYEIDEDGNIYQKSQYVSNIFIGDGIFKEQSTFYLMLCYSDDDGLTWSKPVCLNHQVKTDDMSFIGTGPGVGVKIEQGKYAGRLVFPIYYNKGKGRVLRLSCAVIYSDDGGNSWKMGDTPTHCRKRLGLFSCKDKSVLPHECLSESQLINLQEGGLRLFMRNHSNKKRVAVADSYDGGESWTNFCFDDALKQSICQLSVINAVDGDKPCVVFLNGADSKKRRNGVIRLSYDEGKTWAYSATLREGEFVYSSMVQLPSGDIGVLFEPSTLHESIDWTIVSLDWIKENSHA